MSDFEKKNFSSFFGTLLMVLSKQLSASPDETLAEKFVFRKKAINFIIVGHWTKNIGFCQNLSGRNLIIALYVSLGKLWGEKIFFVTIILIYHLRTSSELFLSLCWKIVRRGSHNYNLHVHGKILMESSIFFGPLPMFISLLANLYGRVVKNAILVSTEIFWGEVFLWKTSLLPPLSHIDRECFGQLSIFLTVSLKLHSTCVEKSFEQAIMKNLFFFIFFGFWADLFQVFFETLSMVLSKLTPASQGERYVEKQFFPANFTILRHCRTWKENRVDFVETVLAWMSNLHSTFPLEYFEEKGLCWNFFFKLWPLDNERTFFLISDENF